MAQNGSDFLNRALHESRRYGADGLVFLRELAQNARDAGARRIDIGLEERDGRWQLVFEDDGRGMSYEHARQYFFRLYASSKEEDAHNAGKFGVGFWSVLRFAPENILVESAGEEAGSGWAVVLDGALANVEHHACRLTAPGTRITLVRRVGPDTSDLHQKIETALHRYCRYLADANGGPRVYFDGREITEPMRLFGPCAAAFKRRGASGIVGLGPEPRVELHSRGLFVRETALLEDLSHRRARDRTTSTAGLAPVFLLNGDELEVVLSRGTVREDRALRRLVGIARSRFRGLIDGFADGIVRRTLWERLADVASEMSDNHRGLARTARGMALAAVGVAAGISMGLGASILTAKRSDVEPTLTLTLPEELASTVPALSADNPLGLLEADDYLGPTVGLHAASAQSVDVRFEPPDQQLWFKILSVDDFHAQHGFRPARGEPPRPASPVTCGDGCTTVRSRVEPGEATRTVLPVPTGYALAAPAPRLGRTQLRPETGASGDVVVELPERPEPSTIVYRVAPRPPVGPRAVQRWRRPISVPLTTALRQRIARARSLPLHQRVERITALSRDILVYDDSLEVAAKYRELEERPWLDRVLAVAAGDCDVKNAFNVILLRELGVAARLAVGYVGEAGQLVGELHAWTEYHDGSRWRVTDATGSGEHAAQHLPPEVAAARASPGSTGEGTDLQPDVAGEPDDETLESWASTGQADPDPATLDWRWLAGGASGLLILVVVLAGRRRKPQPGALDAERRLVLARMLEHSIADPEAWREAPSLQRRRLLPTLRGRAVSLSRVQGLASRGLAYKSRTRGKLATAAARRCVVLDAGDETFGNVIEHIDGIVDLDELETLRRADPPEPDLLRLVNQALRDARLPDVTCVMVDQLDGRRFRDLDLGPLKLGARSPWPRRFIAINLRSRFTQRWLERFDEHPTLAAFEMVDYLADRSLLLIRHGRALRAAVGRMLVREVV